MLRSLLATVSAVVSAVGRAVSYVSRSRIVRVAGKGLMKAAYKIEQFWELAVLPTIGEVAALPLQAAQACISLVGGYRSTPQAQAASDVTQRVSGQASRLAEAEARVAKALAAPALVTPDPASTAYQAAKLIRDGRRISVAQLIDLDPVVGHWIASMSSGTAYAMASASQSAIGNHIKGRARIPGVPAVPTGLEREWIASQIETGRKTVREDVVETSRARRLEAPRFAA